jgi:hypothetical protein
MGHTIEIKREGGSVGKLLQATEVVYSPDDGGYYLGQTDFQTNKRRTSVEIYKSARAAREAFAAGTVEWEE